MIISKDLINEAASELAQFIEASFGCGIDEVAQVMSDIGHAGVRALWLEQIDKLDIDAVVLIQWREDDEPQPAQVVSISRDLYGRVTRIKVQAWRKESQKFDGCISKQLTPETAIKEILNAGGDN